MNQLRKQYTLDEWENLEFLEGVPLDPLIAQRASHASFDPEMLDPSILLSLVQAARCAPSSRNSQPWRFVVIRQGTRRTAINDDLVAWGTPWAAEAPVLIAVVADVTKGTIHCGSNYALFDCGLAVQNVLLQASSLGLAAHPVGFQHMDTVRQALRLPDDQHIVLFIAVGWPDGVEARKDSSRFRKSLAEIAVWDCWDGAPLTT